MENWTRKNTINSEEWLRSHYIDKKLGSRSIQSLCEKNGLFLSWKYIKKCLKRLGLK